MYNIPMDTFLGLMNITKEKFEEETTKQGKRQALFNVVVSKIIEVENLAPTKEDLEARAEEDAKKQNSTKEAMLKTNAQRYYSDIAYQRVIELLYTNAQMSDGSTAAPKKAPAKKATASKSTTSTKATPAKKTTTTKSTTAKASTTKKKPAAKKEE